MGSIELFASYPGATHTKKVNNQIVESEWHNHQAFNGYFGVKTYFYNASNKDIKYVTFTYVPYNQVNDSVTDERGESAVSKKVTGPIAADSLNTVIFDNIWKDGSISSVKVTEISVIFMDETTEVIDCKNITNIFNSPQKHFYLSKYLEKLSQKVHVDQFAGLHTEGEELDFNTNSLFYKNYSEKIKAENERFHEIRQEARAERKEEEEKEKRKKQASKIGCGIAIAIVIAIVAAFVWFASNL